MKKTILTLIAALTVLSLSGVGQAVERQPVSVLPSGVTVKVPNVAAEKAIALGITPGTLEKTVFIHYANNASKARPTKTPTCYKLLRVKWGILPISYVINPALESIVPGAIEASTAAWDNATSKQLFGGYTLDEAADWDDQIPDGRNEYSLGNYPTDGVIAVTVMWSGIPLGERKRQLVEYDVMFDTDFAWGNATSNPAVMDVQNISTHETGHGLGLADIYTSSCAEVTMYGYAAFGETKKSTLEQPDILGLQKLYGM